MIKKQKYKNPSPQFYDELSSFVGKEVIVRCRSEYGFFSINGILKKDQEDYTLFQIFKSDDSKTNPSMAKIEFKSFLVESILHTSIPVIILKPNSNEISKSYRMLFLENKFYDLVNKHVRIDINVDLWKFTEVGSFIMGKLKYNKTEKIFYIQSINTKVQLQFK